MSSLHFLILNMDKNPDRYNNITQMLNNLNCKYSRISAIDGYNMEKDDSATQILHPRKYLFGKIFKSVETGKQWIYDGTILKSFPNLNLLGHQGTKGLTLSNIKAFHSALNINSDWFCILEDDAEIDNESYLLIQEFIQNPKNQNIDIVLLDARHYGWGGTAGMLYNKKIINQLIIDLHPLSNFSILSSQFGDKNLGNVWDWRLWKYVVYINKNFITLPCINSGKFISTIDS